MPTVKCPFEDIYQRITDARKVPYGYRSMSDEELQMHLEGTGWTLKQYQKEWGKRYYPGMR